MRAVAAFLGLLLCIGGASAQTAETLEALARRIELAAASADAARRCVLPGRRLVFTSPDSSKRHGPREIERTRKALKERLALDDAAIERLVCADVEAGGAICRYAPGGRGAGTLHTLRRWRVDPTMLMASISIEAGTWDKQRPRVMWPVPMMRRCSPQSPRPFIPGRSMQAAAVLRWAIWQRSPPTGRTCA